MKDEINILKEENKKLKELIDRKTKKCRKK